MVGMRSKIVLLFILGILFCGTLYILTEVCGAKRAVISIADFQYELVSRKVIGNIETRTFKFSVVLHNSGDKLSDNITVRFEEIELGGFIELGSNFSLKPNESKTLVYEKWPTALTGDLLINISFGPMSPDIQPNSYNSGCRTFILATTDGNDTPSTPGFEITVFLFSIVLILFSKKKKK